MFLFPPTIILRHRKENLKKCSLRGLEQHPDFRFYSYPKDQLPDLSGYFLLAMNAPVLEETDRNLGIFLIDGTWVYAERMERQLPKPHLFQKRSLPKNYLTAYPRSQNGCPDPSRGLASIEALYLAYLLLKRNADGLLDHFYWRNDFLNKNLLNQSFLN